MFYYIYVVCVLLLMFCTWYDYRKDRVEMRLEEMLEAQKDGRTAVGKLSCLTKEGRPEEPFYRAEYMYVIDGKRYFVTYKLNPKWAKESSKRDYDGDILAAEVKKIHNDFLPEGKTFERAL